MRLDETARLDGVQRAVLAVLLTRGILHFSSLISHAQAAYKTKRANRHNDRYNSARFRAAIHDLCEAGLITEEKGSLIDGVIAGYRWDGNYTYQLTFEGWVMATEQQKEGG